MAYKREDILVAWVEALGDVKVANGFFTDAGANAVIRYPFLPEADIIATDYKARTDSSQGMFFLLDSTIPETRDFEKAESGHEHWTLTIQIVAITAKTTTLSVDLNKLIGDVKKLVTQNRKAGGNCVIDSRVDSVVISPTVSKPYAGAVITLEVIYQTTDLNP